MVDSLSVGGGCRCVRGGNQSRCARNHGCTIGRHARKADTVATVVSGRSFDGAVPRPPATWRPGVEGRAPHTHWHAIRRQHCTMPKTAMGNENRYAHHSIQIMNIFKKKANVALGEANVAIGKKQRCPTLGHRWPSWMPMRAPIKGMLPLEMPIEPQLGASLASQMPTMPRVGASLGFKMPMLAFGMQTSAFRTLMPRPSKTTAGSRNRIAAARHGLSTSRMPTHAFRTPIARSGKRASASGNVRARHRPECPRQPEPRT